MILTTHHCDPLHRELVARGVPEELADEICERAAIIEYDAGKIRWKSQIEAQMLRLDEIIWKGDA
ncbi:MAG: hypothetical protein KGN77_05060 [Xanthomonadaceae bacterium]|nr:hypothetical protein [Xanthomonadaceae bacterium]